MPEDTPTLLRELLRRQHRQPYRLFCAEYDRVARRIDRRLVGTYPSQSTYKRWLRGEIVSLPRSESCMVLEAMFPGHTVVELFEPFRDADELQARFPDVNVEDLFAPRTAGAHPEAERLARITAGHLATDRTAVAASAAVLADIRRLEDIAGPHGVMPITRSQHALVAQLARNAAGPARAAAVGLLSELEQYLGWLHMAPTVERWEESGRHLDRAATLALEADDPMRLATALSFAADRHFRVAEWQPAVALNEASSRDRRVDVSLLVFNGFHRAAILAKDGSRHDVVAALRQADSLAERLPPPEELPDSGYWYTESFFQGERAFILDELGDRRQARRLADEAIAAIPVEWTNDEWAARRRRLEQVG